MKTAFSPSWYSSPSMTGRRASYSLRRRSTSAAPWIALTPRQLRAECARSPVVRTSTRSVPWQPASTTALDGSIRIAKSAAISSGCALGEQLEAVVPRVDLLGLVEDVGDVAVGLGHGRGEPQDDRVAALHVAGAEAVQQVAVAAGRQVVVDRHGVEVAGDHDPLAAAEVGARHDGVAVPAHRQVGVRRERGLDGVRDRLLVAADRLDVDQLLGERDGVGR